MNRQCLCLSAESRAAPPTYRQVAIIFFHPTNCGKTPPATLWLSRPSPIGPTQLGSRIANRGTRQALPRAIEHDGPFSRTTPHSADPPWIVIVKIEVRLSLQSACDVLVMDAQVARIAHHQQDPTVLSEPEPPPTFSLAVGVDLGIEPEKLPGSAARTRGCISVRESKSISRNDVPLV